MSPRKVKKCDIMFFSVGLFSAEIQRLKKIQDLGASHDREVREVTSRPGFSSSFIPDLRHDLLSKSLVNSCVFKKSG